MHTWVAGREKPVGKRRWVDEFLGDFALMILGAFLKNMFVDVY